MNFADFSFWTLFGFLLGLLCVMRVAGRRVRLWPSWGDRAGLLAMSLALFFNTSRTGFAIFVVEALLNYAALRVIMYGRGRAPAIARAVAIVFDLAVLVLFKYSGFLMRDVLGITGDLGLLPASFAQSIPPGISFYTFQLIALVIDTGSAAEDVPVTLLDYANFMSLFMQRVAGPIERRDDLLPQLQRYTLAYDADAVLEGARFVVLGLFMKLVIADELAAFVNTTEATNPFAVWLSVLSFGLRTYFDFAGYSLIAYGIARLLGIRLTLNFRAPITSLNIQEFWQRWHVTLNTWLSDYALTPLLLKWKGKHVTAALLLVFLGAGIWHGAGWNYALFGLYHGVALAIYRAYGRRMKMPRVVARIVTLSTVMGGWLLFMQPTLSSLAARLSCVAHLNRYTPHNLVLAFPQLRVELVAFSWTYLLAGLWIALEFASVSDARDDGYAIHRRPVVAQAVVAASVLFAARAGAQFVYFAF